MSRSRKSRSSIIKPEKTRKKASYIHYILFFLGCPTESDYREHLIDDFEKTYSYDKMGKNLVVLNKFKCTGTYKNQNPKEITLAIKRSKICFGVITDDTNIEDMNISILKANRYNKPIVLIYTNQNLLDENSSINLFAQKSIVIEKNDLETEYIKKFTPIYNFIYEYMLFEGYYAESIPEKRLWNELKKNFSDMTMQYNVTTMNDHVYSLDFAIPKCKFGIEIDGFKYHDRNQEEFTKERRRLRHLQQANWHIIKFSAIEINQNLQNCVEYIKSELNKRREIIKILKNHKFEF